MSKPSTSFSLTEPGEFVIGVNYWASHAGTRMWQDWNPKTVREDLQRLRDLGIQCMRVFPLWPDFQPIMLLASAQGRPREIRYTDESPLPQTPSGQAGLSEVMLGRFAAFADLCHEYNLRLIVGLLTGWMSSRLYVPPALQGRNVLTDPFCLQWETRFVREFIRRFLDHPAIYAWDLGNECNVMGDVKTSAEAFSWSSAIANTIRANDPTRPVVSGMHSLGLQEANNKWLIVDQAETTDILTTHPYPYWVDWCRTDAVNSLRILMHATAETRLYGDVGAAPSIVEEVGTMGPMISDELASAQFTLVNLFSLWAHDCRSFIWWCASDQDQLNHPPYDWNAVERELGLIRMNGEAKPAALAMRDFRKWLDELPIKALPPRITDAVCILTRNQDQWAAAFSAFVLARQAGLDIVFRYIDQPIPESTCYLMPSLCSPEAVPNHIWLKILERVKNGAVLYMSLDDAILEPFNKVTGMTIITRAQPSQPREVILPSGARLPINSGDDLRIELQSAQVIAREADGNPVYTQAKYGKGSVFCLTFPVETQVTKSPGAFNPANNLPWYEIYRKAASAAGTEKVLRWSHPNVAWTEHPLAANLRVVVMINYGSVDTEVELDLKEGWRVSRTLYGQDAATGKVSIGHHDAMVFMITETENA